MSKITAGFTLNDSWKKKIVPEQTSKVSTPLKYFPHRELERSRPVLGSMLTGFAESLGIETIQDAIWFFGLNSTIWYEFTQVGNKIAKAKTVKSGQGKSLRTRRGPNLPVDLSLALLCRFYDAYPSYVKNIDLTLPDLALLSDLLDQSTGTKNSIGLLLGRNSSAAYRWRKDSHSATPTVLRLASSLLRFLAEEEYSVMSEVQLFRDQLCDQLLTLRARDKIREWSELVDFERSLIADQVE